MAISLKNVDDRLKLIESKSIVYVVQQKVSGNNWGIELSNGLIINAGINSEPSNWGKINYLIPYTTSHKLTGYVTFMGTTTQVSDWGVWMRFLDIYGFTFGFCDDIGTAGDQGAWMVMGLKLYYNFSYNIIYKILSSIKFKISQIISSPKIKRRRKKYGYKS